MFLFLTHCHSTLLKGDTKPPKELPLFDSDEAEIQIRPQKVRPREGAASAWGAPESIIGDAHRDPLGSPPQPRPKIQSKKRGDDRVLSRRVETPGHIPKEAAQTMFG